MDGRVSGKEGKREREKRKETDRQTGRQTDTQTHRERKEIEREEIEEQRGGGEERETGRAEQWYSYAIMLHMKICRRYLSPSL